jgi:transcriptional regulator with XRE-family HTH domain
MIMSEEIRQKILYLRDVLKLTFPQIGEKTGMSRKSVSRIYQGNYLKRGRPEQSLLDKYSSLIGNWFADYPRINAKQIYAWLKERGVEISYDRVAQYTRVWRKKKEKLYHPLTFLPGEEGQVDWFFVAHPRLGKLSCFVLVLSFSRYLFAYAFPRSSFLVFY